MYTQRYGVLQDNDKAIYYLKKDMEVNICGGAEGENRTPTMSPSTDFESAASTSSATPA